MIRRVSHLPALAGGLALALALAPGAQARARPAPAEPAQASQARVLELARTLIALRSVEGPGNQTPAALEAVKRELVAGGWKPGEVEIVPAGGTAYMVATWPGRDPRLKPLVISGHMDVVEADPKDWARDPFTPVIEDGILYGRGASDMKFDAALVTVSLADLRRSGFRPDRTIVLEFSGDEETVMATSKLIAARLRNAEMVISVDGGGGLLDDHTGKPLYWTWEGAEKTYVDYQLEVTNPGGHSSTPTADNAIVRLAAALGRVGAYRFPAEQNPITRAYFERAAEFVTDPAVAAAMRAFAADPRDEQALAVLRGKPAYVGVVGTTCVPTMIHGGHAQNALPQRVTANVNCRIFPGHTRAEIRAELERIVGDPAVSITDTSGDATTESPASPIRADFAAAAGRAIGKAYPGVPVIPTQASGASDCMWYRALGVPAYNARPVFVRPSEEFPHGLNERIRLSNIRPGLTYYSSLIPDLSR